MTIGLLTIAGLLVAVSGQPTGSDITLVPTPSGRDLYTFTEADHRLMDQVQYACFQYFWKEVGSPSCLVKDRYKGPVSSIAAVGFQLSSLPIGVERGWISRQDGDARARTILATLIGRQDNKQSGVYLHFPDLNTGGLGTEGYELVASTVDHALLLAGAMTAAEYFGGEVDRLCDRMIGETNWPFFAAGPQGFLSMGWKPDDPTNMAGPGRLLDHNWHDAGDEERLIYFLAVGSPHPDYAIEPRVYYRLQRVIKSHGDMPPFVVSWPGALFTYFFSHCWIDTRALGKDDPSQFGVGETAVDWFENSRRAVLTHRGRCLSERERFRTLGGDRWGLSACAGRDGYIVPHVQPNLAMKDEWFEGTVAPYAAISSIMFTPSESLAALREFMALRDAQGRPLIWREPAVGGYGFVDAFNLDQGYVSDDYIGIDQGPMLLALENVRTGLIWKLFMRHEVSRLAVDRLKLRQESERN